MTMQRTAYCHFENFLNLYAKRKKGCEKMICIFSQPPSYVQQYSQSDVCSLNVRQSHIYLPSPNDWWTTGRSGPQAADSG